MNGSKMRAGDAQVVNRRVDPSLISSTWVSFLVVLRYNTRIYLDFSARFSVQSLNTLNWRSLIQHAVRVVEVVLHLHMLLHPRFHRSVTDTEVCFRQTQTASLCCLCQPDKHSSQSPFRSGLAHRLQRETSVGCFGSFPQSVCQFAVSCWSGSVQLVYLSVSEENSCAAKKAECRIWILIGSQPWAASFTLDGAGLSAVTVFLLFVRNLYNWCCCKKHLLCS